jgi:hypothetical protein
VRTQALLRGRSEGEQAKTEPLFLTALEVEAGGK